MANDFHPWQWKDWAGRLKPALGDRKAFAHKYKKFVKKGDPAKSHGGKWMFSPNNEGEPFDAVGAVSLADVLMQQADLTGQGKYRRGGKKVLRPVLTNAKKGGLSIKGKNGNYLLASAGRSKRMNGDVLNKHVVAGRILAEMADQKRVGGKMGKQVARTARGAAKQLGSNDPYGLHAFVPKNKAMPFKYRRKTTPGDPDWGHHAIVMHNLPGLFQTTGVDPKIIKSEAQYMLANAQQNYNKINKQSGRSLDPVVQWLLSITA